jgi:hypothetical protein
MGVTVPKHQVIKGTEDVEVKHVASVNGGQLLVSGFTDIPSGKAARWTRQPVSELFHFCTITVNKSRVTDVFRYLSIRPAWTTGALAWRHRSE